MSLSPSSDIGSTGTTFHGLIHTPEAVMQPFMPGQCLFCPKFSSDFTDSVMHMQKSHGLFVPSQQHLVVDLAALFKYLHLVIFGYRECLHCGTERATVQAVQQHMTGKGHCRFDISDQDSEFTEFYDFFEPKDDIEDVTKDNGYKANQKPLLINQESLHLPSGRIVSRQFPVQQGPSFTRLRLRRRTQAQSPRSVHSLVKLDNNERSSTLELDADTSNTQPLSKRAKRKTAEATYRKTNMRAKDRNTLMHLPPSEQRSVIAKQQKCEKKMQKKEGRKQNKLDQKGNKNLYAYWATETPVYQCG
ncbi:C2H2 type zinc-finger-domain-containing protein [Colletotrichum cereale]|nr:C2H2 type zinc-finger-domain-containing protein [Colletotrichum cereale]